MTTAHDPIRPGEILLEEFLTPMGITQYRLARTMSVPARRINEIVHGKRAISPNTALRLSRALGTSDRLDQRPEPIYSPCPVGLPSIRFLENAAMSPWSPS